MKKLFQIYQDPETISSDKDDEDDKPIPEPGGPGV